MPVKQANNFHVQRELSEPFLHPEPSFCPCMKIFYQFHPTEHKPFFRDFTGARVHSGNSHNQRKHNKVHAFIQALIFKTQFHPCCNDNFVVAKDTLLKSLLRSCFQMENLIFLLISLIYKKENKQREFEFPPFWSVAFPIEIWCTHPLCMGLACAFIWPRCLDTAAKSVCMLWYASEETVTNY